MSILSTTNLTKRFGDTVVLDGITTSFERGTITSIIGPSGSGKSTLLRCLNQLEDASGGTIHFHGDDLTSRDANLDRIRQRIGMVFQSFQLFANMSVVENVAFGPRKILGLTKKDAHDRAILWLKQVGMESFRDRAVQTLSGGQQQRVAIARTLAMEPEVLLFDEPTSALDPMMVGEVLDVIRAVATGDYTIVVVTHEMAFARDISDRVLFMEEGKIVVDGTSEDVFTKPDHPRLVTYLRRFHQS